MSATNNLISLESVFNLHMNTDSWNDIKHYIEEYKYIIKARDMKRQTIIHRSPQHSFRGYLVENLKNISIRKELSHCCLHLAVYFLDLFMDNHSVTEQKLLLLSQVCLWIAGKMEDSKKIIKITDVASTSSYSGSDYRKLEILILNYFNFDVLFPTPALYIHYYIQAALNMNDLEILKISLITALDKLHIEIRKYLDKILGGILPFVRGGNCKLFLDVHYNQQCYPSLMAAAIISASRLEIGLPGWSIEMKILTDYSEADIEATRRLLKKTALTCQKCKKKTGSPSSVLLL